MLHADYTFPNGLPGAQPRLIQQRSDRYTLHTLVDVGHHARRTARHVRQDPADHYRVFVPISGMAMARTGSNDGMMVPGVAVIGTPGVMEFSGSGLRGYILELPVRDISEPLRLSAPLSAQIDLRSGHGLMISDMIQNLSKWRDTLTGLDFDARCQDLAVLICKALGGDPQLSRAERGLLAPLARQRMRQRIRTDGARTLNPKALAADLGWSQRTLQSAMTEAGTTYSDMLRDERLEEAHRRLSQFHYQTVADVSEDCGFSSPGYFSTAFRGRYGETPRELQQRTRAARLGVPGAANRRISPHPPLARG
ncbi:AraC family transcriptional regulator [Streptomyces sp.]|uniref:AraC family transcriptional regulator n=1 Tax=Streptomyces sp. TaxID=1931 RepID=UPI002F42B4C9